MNIGRPSLLKDHQRRNVPQYYDYAEQKFKPISFEDVSHVNVATTAVQIGMDGSVPVVLANQYLAPDGQWYVYNPLTFRAEHDEDIDLSIVVRSVNGILPDEDGNITLICDHVGPDLSPYATLEDLEDFASNAQLSNYALKSEIPEPQDISHLATRGELQQLEHDLGEYLEDFATLEDIVDLVERGELPEFNDFATKVEMYQELNNYVNHAEAQVFARLTELEDYALKTEIPKVPKFYSTFATVTESGAWSVDYSGEGFTKVYSVTPTPIASAESAAHMPISANLTSISLTGASGIAYKASSAGLLAAMQQIRADAGTQIQVLVIGE